MILLLNQIRLILTEFGAGLGLLSVPNKFDNKSDVVHKCTFLFFLDSYFVLEKTPSVKRDHIISVSDPFSFHLSAFELISVMIEELAALYDLITLHVKKSFSFFFLLPLHFLCNRNSFY